MGRPRASREVARWRARAQAELGGPCIARNAYLALGHAAPRSWALAYSKFKLPLMTKLHRKQSTKSSFHRDLVAINVTWPFKTAVDHMGPMCAVRYAPLCFHCASPHPPSPLRPRTVILVPTDRLRYLCIASQEAWADQTLLDAIPPSTLAPRSIHDLPTALQPRRPTAAPAHTALWTPNRLDPKRSA